MRTVSIGKKEMEVAWAAHHATLLRHAQQFLGVRGCDASDYVQDTMVRFIAAFPDGPPPEPRCGGWLMTTLTNLLLGDWRKGVVRRRALADPAIHLVTAPQPESALEASPSSVADTKLNWISSDQFEAAVDSMSHKLREVYELHILGLSHLQIAEQLAITVVAARKRLHDARVYLKARVPLGPDGSAS